MSVQRSSGGHGENVYFSNTASPENQRSLRDFLSVNKKTERRYSIDTDALVVAIAVPLTSSMGAVRGDILQIRR